MAKTTFAAVFKMATAGSTPVAIANLFAITAPTITRNAVDVTTHDSAEGASEFIADGVFDPGEFNLSGLLIGNSTADLAFDAALASGDLQDWAFEFNAASGKAPRSGSGIVTSYSLGEFAVAGRQEFTATIKVSGPITGPTA